MGRAPRQADVARVAGVSQATVSTVLGGNRAGVRLSEGTRRRVLEAAARLGYPTPARTGLLGVHLAPAGERRGQLALTGVAAEAAVLGQDLIVFTDVRRALLADGCLVLGRLDEPTVRELLARDRPVVCLGRRPELGGQLPYVGAAVEAAAREAVARLTRAGHRCIAYVRAPLAVPDDRERGVRAAAADHGVELHPNPGATGVTAVITDEAGFDRVAGTRLPIAVLGPPPGGERPGVSGFDVPYPELGRAAVRLLVACLTPGGPPPAPLLLPCPVLDGGPAPASC